MCVAGGGMYCATKFAVDALTTATRHDVIESSNVRVSAISPGAVKTGAFPVAGSLSNMCYFEQVLFLTSALSNKCSFELRYSIDSTDKVLFQTGLW